jgi:hypothetical protein
LKFFAKLRVHPCKAIGSSRRIRRGEFNPNSQIKTACGKSALLIWEFGFKRPRKRRDGDSQFPRQAISSSACFPRRSLPNQRFAKNSTELPNAPLEFHPTSFQLPRNSLSPTR